ncbi:MAG: hypothetical protein KC416_16930, partial [Myxococcales bacterium]|nr:hypothetical protein [Myxococcales bacterium]
MRKVIAILLPALALFGCEEEQKGLAIDITIDSNIRIAGADRDIDRMDISVISDTGRRLKDGTRTWSVAGGNLRRTGTFLVEPATGDDSTALTITGTLIETTDDGPVLVAQRVIKPPFNPNQFTRVELKFDLACL